VGLISDLTFEWGGLHRAIRELRDEYGIEVPGFDFENIAQGCKT